MGFKLDARIKVIYVITFVHTVLHIVTLALSFWFMTLTNFGFHPQSVSKSISTIIIFFPHTSSVTVKNIKIVLLNRLYEILSR